jgi:hypothetical protein
MAVDYSQYAQIYGGGSQAQQGAAQIGSAIGRGFSAIPNKMDRLAASQSEGLDNAFAPLMNLLNKRVEEWGDVNTSIPSAGEAYMTWVNSLEPREKKIARRGGILDPLRFKQQYDAQMDMYLPSIKQKLEAYRQLTGKSDDKMRDFLSTKQSLNSFLLANTSAEELATTNQYFKPEKSWKQWWQNKDAVGMPWYTEDVSKAEIPIGGTLAAAGALRMGRGIAKKGPVAYAKASQPFGKKRTLTLSDKGFKMAEKTGANKGKNIPWKNTTKYKNLTKAQDAAKVANKGAKVGAAKAPMQTITKYIKKHGVSGLIKKIANKTTWKVAARLVGRQTLSLAMKGTGVGAVASLALDVATVWEIARLISDFNE